MDKIHGSESIGFDGHEVNFMEQNQLANVDRAETQLNIANSRLPFRNLVNSLTMELETAKLTSQFPFFQKDPKTSDSLDSNHRDLRLPELSEPPMEPEPTLSKSAARKPRGKYKILKLHEKKKIIESLKSYEDIRSGAKELGVSPKYLKQWTKEDRSHLKGTGRLW
jgi:hypothetical protein